MPLNRGDVERFRSWILRRFGLIFDDGKLEYLGDVLFKRMDRRGMKHPIAYLDLLDSTDREECSALADELTVGETYFFRNPDHFKALGEILIAGSSANRPIRVFSAGCASGEEPYSIAIAARERCVETRVAVLGADVNPSALKRAKEGRFSAWALRETPKEIAERYFTAEGRDYVLDESVRSMVSFEERNLLDEDPSFWRKEWFDVVFCRNVTMYFAPEATRAVIARMAQALAPGGYLFLGHAETLRGISQQFHLCHTHGTFYYQRKGGAGEALPTTLSFVPETAAPPSDSAAWVDSIRGASERIAALAKDARFQERGESSARIPDRETVLDLFRQERFGDALEALRGSDDADPDRLLLKAVLLTNLGRPADAEKVCRDVLALDDLNSGAHYLTALCKESGGDVSGAVEHDRTAIYLDPTFAMPHVHLGLLAKRQGQTEAAARELSESVTLLGREDASRIVMFGGGFTRSGLQQLCRAELLKFGVSK